MKNFDVRIHQNFIEILLPAPPLNLLNLVTRQKVKPCAYAFQWRQASNSCLATRSSCRCISVLSTPSLNNMSTRIVSTHLLFTRKNSLRNATKCFSSIATIATYRSIFRNKPRFPYEETHSEDIWWRFNLFHFPGTASGFTDQRGELIYS